MFLRIRRTIMLFAVSIMFCISLFGCGGKQVKENLNENTGDVQDKGKSLMDFQELRGMNYYEALDKLRSAGVKVSEIDDETDLIRIDLDLPQRPQGIYCKNGEKETPDSWKLAIWDGTVSVYGIEFGTFPTFEEFKSAISKVFVAKGYSMHETSTSVTFSIDPRGYGRNYLFTMDGFTIFGVY